MEFLANLLSFLSFNAGLQNSKITLIWFTDEPTCPKELL